ncbi:MAG: flagellar hook-basal body complex protein FliE [Thermoleophilia bacterium]|nr:flagellar hook-basal body complex protein FliE [Thermoleophilia bacterium]
MAPLGGINAGISLPMELLDGGAVRGAGTAVAGAEQTTGAGSFSAVLKDKLTSLNAQQVDASSASQDMATGNVDDVAQSMLRIEQANVSLQMATQVRNKVIEAYQEILRMQM